MKWLHSGLFRRFVLVLGALALLPVAFLAMQLVDISQKGIQAAVLELHTKLAEKLAEQIDSYFKVNDDKLAFALASLQKKMEWSDKQELLRSLIETHTDIVEISILNIQGREIIKVYNPDLSSEEKLIFRGKEEGFVQVIKSRRRVSNILRRGDVPDLEMYYPMGPLVFARVLVSLRRLSSRIAQERVGGSGFAVLIDTQGRPLFYPKERLNAQVLEKLSSWPIATAALQSQTIGSSEFSDSEGVSHVGAYAPVSSIGGAVIMLQLRDEAYLSAMRMRRTAIWVLVFVSAFAVLGATFLARRLTSPLLSLTRGAEAVANGDFQIRVDVKTGDELQDLAMTFNKMASELHRYSILQVDRVIAEQRKTSAILFSINDGILMMDQAGRVQLANRRVREMLGLGAGAVIEGKALPEIGVEPKLLDCIRNICVDPQPNIFKDVDLSTEKNRRFLRITAYPVVTPVIGIHVRTDLAPSGKNNAPEATVLGVVVGVRDVTYEKELDQMKEEFLHYITHDLRNPLGSAMGFIDVLLKGVVGPLNPEQTSMVSSVKRSSSRLMSMINNILDIAKMESGRIHLQLKTVSLSALAKRAVEILESLAQQKHIRIELDVPSDCEVEADADLLERVVTNLLGNAIKYTPKDGTIILSVMEEADFVQVCVADTGEGIPKEYCEKIFQKFEQVAGQKRGGTGLGLTIAKFFINSHMGKIWVESEVGKGSRFYFTIPKNLELDWQGAVAVKKSQVES